MPAPRHIIDSLECVISVYFSSARHGLRAAFILCDELVEVTCRERAKQADRRLDRIGFYDLLKHRGVRLDPNTTPLGASLLASRKTRNNMQHVNPAATVDAQHCADSILDAVKTIEHCFAGACKDLPDALRVAMRVTRLHATGSDPLQRAAFARAMQLHDWRTTPTLVRQKAPRPHETVIAPGDRDFWGVTIFREHVKVNTLLTGLGVPL